MRAYSDPRVSQAMALVRALGHASNAENVLDAERELHEYLAAEFAKVPSAPVEAVPQKHVTKENGDCPHWCEACRVEALQRATTPPQDKSSPGMSKSWQTAVAVAREAPSGRTVVDSAVILAIDKRLSEAFAELQEVRKDAGRLDWLLPNLHPATWGMEFEGGYDWASPAELLAKWRKSIDDELAAAPEAPKP